MRQSSRLAVAAILFSPLLSPSWAGAGTTTYTVTPTDQTGTGYGASADAGGGIAVGDTTDGAPGWGSSSFISVGINSEFDIVPTQIPALGTLKISDLKSISYNSKNNSSTTEDWDLRIYTVNDGSNPKDTTFYLNRFESPNPQAGNTNWHAWSTDNSVAVTNVHGGDKTDTAVNTSADGLNDLDANYGTETIEYIAFISGFSGQQTPITDNLDGITFTLNNGNVVKFDLVPEPASLSILGIGTIKLLTRRRRV